jgi:hypothetical protein
MNVPFINPNLLTRYRLKIGFPIVPSIAETDGPLGDGASLARM